jgi:LemA protein
MHTAGILGSIALLAAGILVWAISIYNRLISRRTLKEEAWSGIDVQLKRRHDLVGNLVNAVKGTMQHERGLLEEVARVRSAAQQAGGAAAVAAAEAGLGQGLGRLFAVMENYPALKADANAMQLQQELSSLENDIQLARRYFNATVRDLNILIQSFPSSVIARHFKFREGEFFELDNAAEKARPQVSL